MQKLREKLLVFRVSEGKDHRAFETLYNSYRQKIYQFVYFKVSSQDEAEDLAAQVFLKAWEYLTDENAKRVQNFRAFIYQLSRNLVIDFYRRQGRSPQKVDLETVEEELTIEDPRSAALLNQFLYAEDRAYLSKYLKDIKDEYREAIMLRYLEEATMEEIAEIIGKTSGNVRVLIHRGLNALRSAMLADHAPRPQK
ncbi:RNA polymerase sigma factor [Candidatus Uhrbacteria bacterium]|nr:RNA polymerase sigma factor [Candidatus Uhrbacteria bacterium]